MTTIKMGDYQFKPTTAYVLVRDGQIVEVVMTYAQADKRYMELGNVYLRRVTVTDSGYDCLNVPPEKPPLTFQVRSETPEATNESISAEGMRRVREVGGMRNLSVGGKFLVSIADSHEALRRQLGEATVKIATLRCDLEEARDLYEANHG